MSILINRFILNAGEMNMNKIGIDVSSYQGKIDWAKVKDNGIEFAIIKIIRKDLYPDNQFETNWKGCNDCGITIQGVYNYSYADSVQKAENDAKEVIKILNGRKAMVWFDSEDDCQKNLGPKLISVINAYAAVILNAGLQFGVYSGEWFYKTYIQSQGSLNYPVWIANYGNNTGKLEPVHEPKIAGMVGWQYTSMGKVNGISGTVDMNIWYDDIQNRNSQK